MSLHRSKDKMNQTEHAEKKHFAFFYVFILMDFMFCSKFMYVSVNHSC